jgi:hypothetical protein
MTFPARPHNGNNDRLLFRRHGSTARYKTMVILGMLHSRTGLHRIFGNLLSAGKWIADFVQNGGSRGFLLVLKVTSVSKGGA